MEPVVLAAATDYGPEQLRPFVISLREHYDGPVVFFTQRLGPGASELLARYDVTAVSPKFVRPPMRPDQGPMHLVVTRFFLFKSYLEKEREKLSHVFISDVRDVIFQGNPFDMPWRGRVAFFLEDDHQTIGASPGSDSGFGIHSVRGTECRINS